MMSSGVASPGGVGQEEAKEPKRRNVIVRIITAPIELFRHHPKKSSSVVAPPPTNADASPVVMPHPPSPSSGAAMRFQPFVEGVPRTDHLAQGAALLARGDADGAAAELSVAAATGPDLAEANTLLGAAYDRRGEFAKAQEAYRRALELSPQKASALVGLGVTLIHTSRYKEAEGVLKRAVRLAPHDASALHTLAMAQYAQGKYDAAFKNLSLAAGERAAHIEIAALLNQTTQDWDTHAALNITSFGNCSKAFVTASSS